MNLLPLQDKKDIKREYKFRVVAVGLVFLFFLLILSMVLLIPPSIFLLYKSSIDKSLVHALPLADPHITAHNTQQNATIKVMLSLFSTTSTSSPLMLTDLISYVDKDRGSGVFVTEFNFSQKPNAPFALVISGVAQNRNALLSFIETLQQEQGIAHIDVPVSSFAKDTNIPFSFTLKPYIPSK